MNTAHQAHYEKAPNTHQLFDEKGLLKKNVITDLPNVDIKLLCKDYFLVTYNGTNRIVGKNGTPLKGLENGFKSLTSIQRKGKTLIIKVISNNSPSITIEIPTSYPSNKDFLEEGYQWEHTTVINGSGYNIYRKDGKFYAKSEIDGTDIFGLKDGFDRIESQGTSPTNGKLVIEFIIDGKCVYINTNQYEKQYILDNIYGTTIEEDLQELFGKNFSFEMLKNKGIIVKTIFLKMLKKLEEYGNELIERLEYEKALKYFTDLYDEIVKYYNEDPDFQEIKNKLKNKINELNKKINKK